MRKYTPRNWYWIVAGDSSQVYSSKDAAYVQPSDAGFLAWLESGNKPTRIASETELWNVLTGIDPNLVPAAGTSARKDLQIAKVDMVALTALFNHENRIRALESKTPLTVPQFRAAIKLLIN